MKLCLYKQLNFPWDTRTGVLVEGGVADLVPALGLAR